MSLGVSQVLDTSKRHLAICVFNRATYSRCKELIREISNHQNYSLDVILASGAIQKEHGDAKGYIQSDAKKTSIIQIPVEIKDTSHRGSAMVAGHLIHALTDHFSNNLYGAVIVVGDRFETLAAALAVSYLNIPLIHLQGGEVTGNIDEKVRHAVTKLADYHFVATPASKNYVIDMGEERSRVFQTGCPSLDVIKNNHIKRHKPPKRYLMCQFHPHTTESTEAYKQTKAVMDAIIEFCANSRHVCYVYWPNPDPGREDVVKLLEEYHKQYSAFLIKAKNEPPIDFLDRLAGATFMIGNSSCGLRECSFLGIPAINVGNRQAIRERSWNVIDVGFVNRELIGAMERQKEVWRYRTSLLYGDGRASYYIVRHFDHIHPFSIKGPLTYPTMFKNQDLHFGEKRFETHAKSHRKTDYGQYQRRIQKENKAGT